MAAMPQAVQQVCSQTHHSEPNLACSMGIFVQPGVSYSAPPAMSVTTPIVSVSTSLVPASVPVGSTISPDLFNGQPAQTGMAVGTPFQPAPPQGPGVMGMPNVSQSPNYMAYPPMPYTPYGYQPSYMVPWPYPYQYGFCQPVPQPVSMCQNLVPPVQQLKMTPQFAAHSALHQPETLQYVPTALQYVPSAIKPDQTPQPAVTLAQQPVPAPQTVLTCQSMEACPEQPVTLQSSATKPNLKLLDSEPTNFSVPPAKTPVSAPLVLAPFLAIDVSMPKNGAPESNGNNSGIGPKDVSLTHICPIFPDTASRSPPAANYQNQPTSRKQTVGDYKFSPEFTTTPEMVTKFNENGYIIVRNLFNAEEVKKISSVVENAQEMKKYKFGVKDENGNESAQITWNHPGNDVTGMAARCQKIVTTAEKLLGGEVYHYHSKVVLKDPKTGGGRAWHQDYGYWYQNGCLFPDMLTVFVAIDKADAENGCLEVLPGSHLCGRVEHQLTGSETGADKERVQQLMKVLPRLQVEMESGDAIFFHCNLLHYSAANHSQRRRLAFLVAYNMAANDPVRESHHPRYTPLEKVDDDAVLRCTNTSDLSGKDFLDMPNLKSLQSQTKFK